MTMLIPRIRRMLGAIQTVWSIAGLTLLAILVTEAGFRLVFAIKDRLAAQPSPDPRVIQDGYGGESWPKQHYHELESLEARWQPYVYFRQKPYSGRTITIDGEGRRATWQPPPAPADRAVPRPLRVLMLGGSSLWGFGARDDRTIPSLIARKLHAKGHPVEVKNLAEIGYVSTQEVVALVRELQAGYRPDLVIFYDGVNDTTSALLEGEPGVTTNEHNRRDEFNIRRSLARLGAAAAARLIQDSACSRFAHAVGRRLIATGSSAEGSPSPERRTELAAAVVRRYQANLAIVAGLAREFGFKPMFFWQPVVFEKQALMPFEQEQADKLRWTSAFFRQVHQALRHSADLRNEPAFHDLSRLFEHSKDLVFIDYCHTTEAANERIANAIVESLEGSRALPPSPIPSIPPRTSPP